MSSEQLLSATVETSAEKSDYCAVVDYGMGNLHSLAKAVQHVAPDIPLRVSADPAEIAAAERVIVPGVGAIRDCMAAFSAAGMDRAVRASIHRERPLLAICIGMQLLLEYSEENGGIECLGIFPGRVRGFDSGERDEQGRLQKVPHMGWNRVWQTAEHPLWQGIASGSFFYFVHSYYAECGVASAAETEYGIRFSAALARENIFAVQFHPEKSQRDGLHFLKNFMHWRI